MMKAREMRYRLMMMRDRRQLRTLFVVLLLICGGAIVNVVVAWWCCRLQLEGGEGGYAHLGGPTWDFSFWQRRGAEQFRAAAAFKDPQAARGEFFAGDVIPSWSRLTQRPALDRDPELLFIEEGRGWPMLSMYWHADAHIIIDQDERSIDPVGLSRPLLELHDGIDLGRPELWANPILKVRVLPLRPIWPGFVINTIFYAAMLWLIFAIPGFVRRRVRIQRGRCTACGYDLRGTDHKVCPECGAAASKPL